MTKQFAWSYSALTSFEQCPKKHYHTRIAKNVREKETQAMSYGKEVHTAFEKRLIKGTRLPLDLQHHEEALAKLDAKDGQGMPEQKLALNREFQPTGFFDPDVWVRGIIDYAKVTDQALLIVDHKTGRMFEDFDQVKLMAAMMSAYMPEIEAFVTAYYWTKEKKFTQCTLTREEVPDIWNLFIPRANEMEEKINAEDFPARPNYLCKRYCPIKSCKYNGE